VFVGDDVTDRKQAEQRLASEREMLAMVIEGTRAGTWEWHVQTGETVFNDRWAHMLGYTLEELQPISIQTWTDLCHPDDLKQSDALLEAHFAGKSPYYELDCRMRHKSGHWVWVKDRGKVVQWSEDGKPLLMTGTHIDITESKMAEIALQQSEKKFRILFDESPQPMVVTEYQDGRIVDANQKFCDLTGFDKFTLIGNTTVQIGYLSVEDRERFTQALTEKGRVDGWKMEFRAVNGTEVVGDVYARPIDISGAPYILTMVIDKTEQKRLEAAVRHAQKVDTMATLVGGIAHDCNNLVTVILGHLRLAMQDATPDSDQAVSLNEVEKASGKLRDLTHELMSISRGSKPVTQGVE
jgi:PAS domain S-box-containing protein